MREAGCRVVYCIYTKSTRDSRYRKRIRATKVAETKRKKKKKKTEMTKREETRACIYIYASISYIPGLHGGTPLSGGVSRVSPERCTGRLSLSLFLYNAYSRSSSSRTRFYCIYYKRDERFESCTLCCLLFFFFVSGEESSNALRDT